MAEQNKDKKDKKPKGGAGAPTGKVRKPKADAGPALDTGADEASAQPAPPARLYQKYLETIIPALKTELGVGNVHAVPRLEKIVISMGVGRFAVEGGEGKAKIDTVERELTQIAGQKPLRCKAKKAVANFKVREGMETGLKVTLRGTRMFEFLDRMITLAIPRVKDFRGLNPNAFDSDGNFNFGFNEQTVFPEVDASAVTFTQGMNITMVTTAKSIKEGRELLRQFGMPFKTDVKEKD